MSVTYIKAGVIAAAVLGCAFAYGQNSSSSNSGNSSLGNSGAMTAPATTGQDKSTGNNMVGGGQKPSGTTSQPTTGQDKSSGNDMVGQSTRPDFKTLDTKGNGYVTAHDVKSNKWLSKNFSKCDTDHDGHLSQQEYASCK
jgi:hypothetical protein